MLLDLTNRPHGDIVREIDVQRTAQLPKRMFPRQVKRNYLPVCMHPCIGPSCSNHPDWRLADPTKNIFDGLLYRRGVCLPLKTLIEGSVIGNDRSKTHLREALEFLFHQ
jgi:hypothetical protein